MRYKSGNFSHMSLSSQRQPWKNGQKTSKPPWKNGFLLRGRDSNPRPRAYGTLVLPLHNPTRFRCKGRASYLIQQISANLAKIWISESIVASLPPQIIGNYKIDMQPIRLTHKSLLPERPFGRTDAMYIGLMIL